MVNNLVISQKLTYLFNQEIKSGSGGLIDNVEVFFESMRPWGYEGSAIFVTSSDTSLLSVDDVVKCLAATDDKLIYCLHTFVINGEGKFINITNEEQDNIVVYNNFVKAVANHNTDEILIEWSWIVEWPSQKEFMKFTIPAV